MTTPVFIGIDVGTGGVRSVAVTSSGEVLGSARRPLASVRGANGAHEQSPQEWWAALCSITHQLAAELKRGRARLSIESLALCSTSGTLVATAADGAPVRAAILYDDSRPVVVAERLGGNWSAAHSFAKAVWLRQEEPTAWRRTRYLLHPADWLSGKLAGAFGFSDSANALKLGYDAATASWHPAVFEWGCSGLLPSVVEPGSQIGCVAARSAAETGLPAGIKILAGLTDGMASLVASGAHAPGNANTTLGTTMVWKALTADKPVEVHGIYCHRHPAGYWAPGAASNSGPGAMRTTGNLADAEIQRLAQAHLPSGVSCYLLSGVGERFPFRSSSARTFFEPEPREPAHSFAAQLQSLACVERWGYELLEACGVARGEIVYSAGGAAESPVLAQLRADVLQRRILKTCHPYAAFGSAVLAAAGGWYGGDVAEAIRSMTSIAEAHDPDPRAAAQYDEIYHRFREACSRRGYC